MEKNRVGCFAVLGGDHPAVVGRHLELEADELRVRHRDDVVVDEGAVGELHEIERFVVRTRAHAGLVDVHRHLVELIGHLGFFEVPVVAPLFTVGTIICSRPKSFDQAIALARLSRSSGRGSG